MTTQTKRGFGRVRQLPPAKGARTGRWHAFYNDPYGAVRLSASGKPTPVRHNGPHTFDTKLDAESWLLDERRLISNGTWTPPAERKLARKRAAESGAVKLSRYADEWLSNRTVKGRPLAGRTRDEYRRLLDKHILRTFGDLPLTAINTTMIDSWYQTTAKKTPTQRARAYALLRTILGTAVDRDLITTSNPAKVRGGGTATRRHKVEPVNNEELAMMVTVMPERRRLMLPIAAWCALRFGELTELRRKDIDLDRKVIKVQRGVTRVKDTSDLPPDSRLCGCRPSCVIGPPKTEAGVRDVPIPPHLIDDLRNHLDMHTQPGADGLLFAAKTGNHLNAKPFYGAATTFHTKGPKKGEVKRSGYGWHEARRLAGRPTLHFHDLRHTGLTNAAIAGATLAELMALAGHTTPTAAIRYQHAVADRMQDLAAKMSILAGYPAETDQPT